MRLTQLQRRLTVWQLLLFAAGAVTMQPLVWVAFVTVILLQILLMIRFLLQ